MSALDQRLLGQMRAALQPPRSPFGAPTPRAIVLTPRECADWAEAKATGYWPDLPAAPEPPAPSVQRQTVLQSVVDMAPARSLPHLVVLVVLIAACIGLEAFILGLVR